MSNLKLYAAILKLSLKGLGLPTKSFDLFSLNSRLCAPCHKSLSFQKQLAILNEGNCSEIANPMLSWANQGQKKRCR